MRNRRNGWSDVAERHVAQDNVWKMIVTNWDGVEGWIDEGTPLAERFARGARARVWDEHASRAGDADL